MKGGVKGPNKEWSFFCWGGGVTCEGRGKGTK